MFELRNDIVCRILSGSAGRGSAFFAGAVDGAVEPGRARAVVFLVALILLWAK